MQVSSFTTVSSNVLMSEKSGKEILKSELFSQIEKLSHVKFDKTASMYQQYCFFISITILK